MDDWQRKGENEMSECRGHCDKYTGLGVQTRLISTSTSFIVWINLKEKYMQNWGPEVSHF